MSLLLAEGGKVKKRDLVDKFKGLIESGDPAEKERNQELIRGFVNNIAVVKEIDGVRFVVIKKMFQHLLETGLTENQPSGELQRTHAQTECRDELDTPQARERSKNPSELPPNHVQVALHGAKYSDVRIKRKMNFEIHKHETNGESSRRSTVNQPSIVPSKPYALPLRIPPRVEIHHLKADQQDPEASELETQSSFRMTAPQDSLSPVPLGHLEHDWIVKCASGLWSQVYGLLLRDNQLAEKRDFISGFTALHWAAKCGNCDMLVKIMDVSKQAGVDVDINAKTHGGYTPLHIAALHNQEFIMAMLVGEFGANISIRDHGGKKALHYLHKETSGTLRQMMGGVRDELDLIVEEEDLSKGRNTIGRLFPTHKKKTKLRPGFYSLTHNPGEEKDDSGSSFRPRILSDSLR